MGLLLLMVGSVSAVNSEYNMTAFVGNSPPLIVSIPPIGAQNPVQANVTPVPVNFTACDNNLVADLNGTSAQCSFVNGITTRSSTSCSGTPVNTTCVGYTCTVNMEYYDVPGLWTPRCVISDIGGPTSTGLINGTDMTYNSLLAVSLDKNTINFGVITLGIMQPAVNNPLGLINEGNVLVANISLKGYDLNSGPNAIVAGRFNTTSVDVPTSSFFMINDTYMQFASLNLPVGFGSTRTFGFYLDAPVATPIGAYNSDLHPWVMYTEA